MGDPRAGGARGSELSGGADASREKILGYWFAPDKLVYVARRADAVVGTYYLKPNSTGPGAHVVNAGYMVRPDACGGGIGTAMAQDSFVRARDLGFLAMQYNPGSRHQHRGAAPLSPPGHARSRTARAGVRSRSARPGGCGGDVPAALTHMLVVARRNDRLAAVPMRMFVVTVLSAL